MVDLGGHFSGFSVWYSSKHRARDTGCNAVGPDGVHFNISEVALPEMILLVYLPESTHKFLKPLNISMRYNQVSYPVFVFHNSVLQMVLEVNLNLFRLLGEGRNARRMFDLHDDINTPVVVSNFIPQFVQAWWDIVYAIVVTK